jgi:L-ascorbate metabolism protein UlaG (beta-lactamase superfamily)
MNWIPRVHGNGFIQLDLTPTKRLHIWGHPSIPRQKTATPLHDHAFGFTSRILMGALVNKRFIWNTETPYGRYEIHRVNVRDREDTTLHGTGELGDLVHVETEVYFAGDVYSMSPGEIHESEPREISASIIEKTGPTLSQGGPSPRVFVPRGLKPDNTFHRYTMSEEDLWEIIADVLQRGVIDIHGF